MDFKKLAPVIAALIILCAAIAMFFLSYNSQDINPPKTSFITPIPSLISPTPNNEQETAMYNGDALSFEYPKILTLEGNEQSGITLNHAVHYPHQNPCDFSGESIELENITDFLVEIKVFSQSLEEVLIDTQDSSFVKENISQGALQISPGFIDEIKIGNLSGYRITQGVEGCGKYDYYFSENGQIIHIVRSFIPEFDPIHINSQEYLNIKGIIPPEQEAQIFNQIIFSLELNS